MNRSRCLTHRAICLSISALLLGALAAGSASAQAPPVTVKLTDFKIATSTKTAKAGKVTFKVANPAAMVHEMVVIKTNKPAAKLPVKNGRASEAGSVGETGDMKAHATKTITLTLKPGHYALICNIAGHYQAGMRADFTVK